MGDYHTSYSMHHKDLPTLQGLSCLILAQLQDWAATPAGAFYMHTYAYGMHTAYVYL